MKGVDVTNRRIPKKMSCFESLDALAEKMCETAKIFKSSQSPQEKAEALRIIENEADTIVHKLANQLNGHQDPGIETREDIRRLAHIMDNVVDGLEEAADRIVRFSIACDCSVTFQTFGDLAFQASIEIRVAIALLKNIGKNKTEITERCIRINELEHKGDLLHRDALSDIMQKTPATLEEMWHALKTKEVLGLLEYTLDECEDIADLIEALKIKNA